MLPNPHPKTLQAMLTILNSMLDWFHSQPSLLQTYWGIALAFSTFFILQSIMTFIGLGDFDHGDMGGLDADTAGADLGDGGHTLGDGGVWELFSLRNFINFMLGVGWGGVCFYNVIDSPTLLALASLGVGIAFLLIFMFLWKMMFRLESAGNYDIRQAVGLVGDVYLRIGPSRSRAGKVQISLDGSVHEFQAYTDVAEELPSGAKVRVVEVIGADSLLVEKA